MAMSLLGGQSRQVVAAAGKRDAAAWLPDLGAQEVILRETLIDNSARPLLKACWAATVDTVGGDILARPIPGAVSCCGLVASAELHTTVFPFIRRAVSLVGVDLQNTPCELRESTWLSRAELG